MVNVSIADRWCVAQAGARLSTAELLLERSNLTLPVVTSSWEATLAGTVSAGGYGPTSLLNGALADHVDKLTVVTGLGEILEVEDGRSGAELFKFALHGLGQVCVIVVLRIRVMPYSYLTFDEVREHSAREGISSVLAGYVADAETRLLRFSYIQRRDAWRIEVGHRGKGSHQRSDFYRELLARERAFSVKQAGGVRLWADYFVPVPFADEFGHYIRSIYRGSDSPPNIGGTWVRGPLGGGLPLSPSGGNESITFGVYANTSIYESETLVGDLQVLADQCVAVGGRQYLHGFHCAEREFLTRQFGVAVMEQWAAAKRWSDPYDKLGSLYTARPLGYESP